MIQLLHTLPAGLNYNITLVFTLSCISIQIVTGFFLKMSYCFNFQKKTFSKEQFFSSSIFILSDLLLLCPAQRGCSINRTICSRG